MISLALAGLLLAGAPEPKASRPEFDRACMDERGRDLCQPGAFDAMRARLDAPPAEALAREGFEGVRVFPVNGYGVDQPMVSILWKGSAAPVIEARVDRGASKPSILTFTGNSWHRASTRTLARLVGAAPVRLADDKPGPAAKGEIVICLHAWVAVIEAIEGGKVHRRIRNACDEDPIFEGAFQFATFAVNADEACRAIGADDYRNDWGRIGACPAILGPNVVGAAAVLRLSTGDILDDGDYPAGETTEALAPDAVWISPDGTGKGRDEVAAAWRRFAAGDPDAGHWVRTATGAGPVVEVEGIAVRETDGQPCHAASHQSWRRTAGRWRLERWTLEPCLPISERG